MMIGSRLFTKQTGGHGKLCREVMICKRLFTRREYYFSITLDRQSAVSILSFKYYYRISYSIVFSKFVNRFRVRL